MPRRKSKGIKKLPPRLKTTPQGILALPPEDSKTIKFDNRKYVRIAETESHDKFKELGERISRKELKWIYYTIENNVGTHYYLILNVKQ